MQHKHYIQRIHSIDMQTTQKFEIKCDDCKTTIGHTNNMVESVMGGRCEQCSGAI